MVATVTKQFGSRDKLVDAIGAAKGQAKDKDYLAKLATMSLPQLLDLGKAAARRQQAAKAAK